MLAFRKLRVEIYQESKFTRGPYLSTYHHSQNILTVFESLPLPPITMLKGYYCLSVKNKVTLQPQWSHWQLIKFRRVYSFYEYKARARVKLESRVQFESS